MQVLRVDGEATFNTIVGASRREMGQGGLVCTKYEQKLEPRIFMASRQGRAK